MELLTDDGARIAIVALVLMTICSSLLGVLVGWKLRDKEVTELKKSGRYSRWELAKLYERRNERRNECGAVHPQTASMICSRPKDHYVKGTSPHGYAGVFWEEEKV